VCELERSVALVASETRSCRQWKETVMAPMVLKDRVQVGLMLAYVAENAVGGKPGPWIGKNKVPVR